MKTGFRDHKQSDTSTMNRIIGDPLDLEYRYQDIRIAIVKRTDRDGSVLWAPSARPRSVAASRPRVIRPRRCGSRHHGSQRLDRPGGEPHGPRLHEHVSGCRRFDGSCENDQSGTVGDGLAQERVLRPSPDEMDDRYCALGESARPVHRSSEALGERLQDAARESGTVARYR
jgi:hypothetical protein